MSVLLFLPPFPPSAPFPTSAPLGSSATCWGSVQYLPSAHFTPDHFSRHASNLHAEAELQRVGPSGERSPRQRIWATPMPSESIRNTEVCLFAFLNKSNTCSKKNSNGRKGLRIVICFSCDPTAPVSCQEGKEGQVRASKWPWRRAYPSRE